MPTLDYKGSITAILILKIMCENTKAGDMVQLQWRLNIEEVVWILTINTCILLGFAYIMIKQIAYGLAKTLLPQVYVEHWEPDTPKTFLLQEVTFQNQQLSERLLLTFFAC